MLHSRARWLGWLGAAPCFVVWRTTPLLSLLAPCSCYRAIEVSVAESVVGVGYGGAKGRELEVVASGRPTGTAGIPALSGRGVLVLARVLSRWWLSFISASTARVRRHIFRTPSSSTGATARKTAIAAALLLHRAREASLVAGFRCVLACSSWGT